MDDDQRKNRRLTCQIAWAVTIGISTFASVGAFAKAKPKPEKPRPTVRPSLDVLLSQEEPQVVAESAATIDSFTGEFLFVKNENAPQYPASSTKILTALLVIETGDLNKVVTVELSDTKVEPSNLELKPGEQYTRRQLLYPYAQECK